MAKTPKERQQARRDRLKSGLIRVTLLVKQEHADALAEAGVLEEWSVDNRSAEDRQAIAAAVKWILDRLIVTRDEIEKTDLLLLDSKQDKSG